MRAVCFYSVANVNQWGYPVPPRSSLNLAAPIGSCWGVFFYLQASIHHLPPSSSATSMTEHKLVKTVMFGGNRNTVSSWNIFDALR